MTIFILLNATHDFPPSFFSQPGKVVVRKEPLVQEATLELPRINYRHMGKEYRYFYALGNEYLHPNRVRYFCETEKNILFYFQFIQKLN